MRSTAAARRLAGNMRDRHPGNLGKRATLEDIDDQESEEEGIEELELWKLLLCS